MRRKHAVLEAAFHECTLVGVVDATFLLVQYGTKLLLLDHSECAKELFYQLCIRRFGCTGRVHIRTPVSVCDCLTLALESTLEEDSQLKTDSAARAELATAMTEEIMARGPMLAEYFSIGLEEGQLSYLPELLDGHRPAPEALPLFLLSLATDVDYADERTCFEGVATALAVYYARLPIEEEDMGQPQQEPISSLQQKKLASRAVGSRGLHILRNQVLPGLKQHFLPPKEFADDGTVVQVAALEHLYKTFERC
jgi:DNA mismatch repair protein MLH1